MQPIPNGAMTRRARRKRRLRHLFRRGAVLMFFSIIAIALWRMTHRRPMPLPSKTHPVAVIDAGHGAWTSLGLIDFGAERNGLREADIVLDIARRLQVHLERQGWIAVTTRDGAFTPFSLMQRSALANAVKADVLISLHLNSHLSSRARGVSVFYWHPDDASLAALLQEQLSQRLALRNRGIATAPFTVLTTAPVPAVLVELAFISNRQEAKRLRNPVFREKAAKVLAEALTQWHSLVRQPNR